ncbi:MAG: putative short-chain dehydrogenase/reductase [Candidatus Hydrogenedentota bacterium]
MSRTVFITGAAGGIGGYVANRLIQEGDRVFATDVNPEGIEKLASERGWPKDQYMAAEHDVRNAEQWESVFGRAVETFGRIDICFNNAGVMFAGWAHEQPLNELDLQIDINVKGVIYGSQVSARHMIKKGGGHIVNISSMAGIAAIPGIAVYTASKHAVRGFTLALSLELKPYGVATSVVCPHAVNTGLLTQTSQHEAGAMVFSGSRLLNIDEIGNAIVERVFKYRPLEFVMPFQWGMLAKAANAFPAMSGMLADSLRKKGRAQQQKWEHP